VRIVTSFIGRRGKLGMIRISDNQLKALLSDRRFNVLDPREPWESSQCCPSSARRSMVAVVAIGFLIQTYVRRLRPLFAGGATSQERAVLFLLNVAGALSLGCLLWWSARQGHAG
jgi:hypothetical protein